MSDNLIPNKLFFNGSFYLGKNTWCRGLVVDENGIIVQILNDEREIAEFPSSQIQKIDMSGRWILPGFEDAHTHPAGRARTLLELDLRKETIGWEDVKALIKKRAGTTPLNQWIVCHGWNENIWGKITQAELDAISSDHGVFLINISYHGGLLNSKGIELLEKMGTHPTISNGSVTEKAFEEVFIATAPDREAYLSAIPRYQEKLLALGIIAAHDMNVATTEQLEAYFELERTNQLRFFTAMYLNPRLLVFHEQLSAYIREPKEMLKIQGIKLFLDGAIGTSTAAVHQHYIDGTGEGTLRMSREECESVIEKAVSLGLHHVAMHCIGDRAVDLAVTLFETLREKYAKDISTWRFEHFEIPDEKAIRTLAKYGGIASMQPNFSWDAENYQKRLGEDVKKLNPFRAILDAGVHLAFGSDDMPPDPIKGIAWATAKAPFLEQRISVDEAITAYTLGGAYAVQMDHRRGKIAIGYEANFAVLEKNITDIPVSEIENIQVQETWIKGEKVWDRREE